LLMAGDQSNHAYNATKDEIKILYKDGSVVPISKVMDFGLQTNVTKKYYLCYPKGLV
jgi:alpha-glucosidase (family GH31 glycosyl hydrolase)